MKTHHCIGWSGLCLLSFALAQEKPPVIDGTVTLPYQMLRSLDRPAVPLPAPWQPSTVLSSAVYEINLATSPATIEVKMTAHQFRSEWSSLSILSGDVAVASVQPDDALLAMEDQSMKWLTAKPGKHEIRFRLITAAENQFVALPCVSGAVQFSGLPAGKEFVCKVGDQEYTFRENSSLSIPARGARVAWQLVDSQAPEDLPLSQWKWEHEVVAIEQDGWLTMHSFSHASTTEGDTRAATLTLPAGVTRIEARGDHLQNQKIIRNDDGSQGLQLQWQGDRQFHRVIEIRYQQRVNSLQSSWLLAAPIASEKLEHAAQFYLADQPQRKFSAVNLKGPFASQTLSSSLSQKLQGRAYYQIDAPTGSVALEQSIMPIAVTADAVISKARWESRIEADGASLTTGLMDVQYRNGARLPLRLPKDAVLLSCSVDSVDIAPIVVAEGQLEIPLSVQQQTLGNAKVSVSYTERKETLAPLEGKLSMSLPNTSYFIHALQWQVHLPAEYSAEVAGNVRRAIPNTSASHVISLDKNLCRDETPRVELFYNRNQNLR